MIKRFSARGYKTLSEVEVTFDLLTVVLGANSAGKSNLFDALTLLSRIVLAPDLKAAFEDHRGDPLEAFTIGPGGLGELQRQDSLRFDLEVDVELGLDVIDEIARRIAVAREGLTEREGRGSSSEGVRERLLRYEVGIEMRPATGHLRVVHERLLALREDLQPKQSRAPFLETKDDRVVVRMERQSHPRYEEIGLDRSVVSRSWYPPHHPHITAFREEVSRWRFYYLEPTNMRAERPLRDVRSLDAHGREIASFYHTVKTESPAQLKAYALALQSVIPRFEALDAVRTDEGRVRLTATEEGRTVSANLLSEGTLRVLGLLAILNSREPVSTVGFEEPENGIHPRRLQLVADMLLRAARRAKPQLIVNTHSPLLPEYLLGHEHVAVVVCTRESGTASNYVPFGRWGLGEGSLFERDDIGRALDFGAVDARDVPRLSEMLVRGDLGG